MNSHWDRQFGQFKLVKRTALQSRTTIRVLDAEIGGPEFVVMAGPCSVESERQTLETAVAVREAGATILRGGAFKPRSSPYSFQGLGLEGLKILAKARRLTGLAVVTEAMSETDVDLIAEYADILQIGSRNMENSSLLEAVGRCGKPVLLKRGLTARVEDLLASAEIILACGNPDVILCERGIRTFETATRNTLDISAVPVLRSFSHLPVIVDPSHAGGVRELLPALARAGIAVGADGMIVEVHPDPDHAFSDGEQSLTFPLFRSMMAELTPLIAWREDCMASEAGSLAGWS